MYQQDQQYNQWGREIASPSKEFGVLQYNVDKWVWLCALSANTIAIYTPSIPSTHLYKCHMDRGSRHGDTCVYQGESD